MVTGYITYVLLCINGEGHQPYAQVANSGMALEGGMYGNNGRMLGYLIGDPNKIDDTIQSLTMYAAKKLTPEEAMDWVDKCIPINTPTQDMMNQTKKYIGYAYLDTEGRIIKPTTNNIINTLPTTRTIKTPDLASRITELEKRVSDLELINR